MTACHRIALTVLTLCAGCVLTVENGRIQAPDAGNDPIAAGRRIYTTRCASCHGIDGRGDGPVAPALRVAPPDLTWLAERRGGEFPRDFVIATVTGDTAILAHGTREMPIWSDRFASTEGNGGSAAASVYTRRSVEALADYLATIQRRLSAAPRGR